MSLLSARGLCFAYAPGVPAVEQVELELGAGEFVALLGPNAAGKSTFMRLCAGLLTPSAGSVECAGVPLARLPVRERARRIALVPQSLRALPELALGDFVRAGRYAHGTRWKPHGDDARVCASALEACDLAGQEGRLLEELSGGQRQRALLARALAQEARVLLVDEPTNSLDPQHQLQIFALLARLARDGRAVLVATHELNLASQFATRIVLLDHARIAAIGRPIEVLRREVLEPVYGGHLTYGELPTCAGGERRPFVIPWLGPEGTEPHR